MRFEGLTAVGVTGRKLDTSHVIVCGNEKGGSGKSTTAMHVAVSLLNLGFSVATVDLDTRQQTLTRYARYRRRWMERSGDTLPTPAHYLVIEDDIGGISPFSSPEMLAYEAGMDDIRYEHDFVVIDTPGSHTALSVFAHRQADTLITPINDSFIDFDVLANVDPETFEINELAQYAGAVRDARRRRRMKSGGMIDWVVVRNRMAQISSRNEKRVHACLRELSMELGFRIAQGIGERVIFREWFQRGLTALDDVNAQDEAARLSLSHLAARNEMRRLIGALRLPIDENGRKRAETRKQWLATEREPIQLPDIFVS